MISDTYRDRLARLRGHFATVNGEPAEYDETTGIVRWERAIGSLNFNVVRDRGTWLDNVTWSIDGKTIRFAPRCKTSG